MRRAVTSVDSQTAIDSTFNQVIAHRDIRWSNIEDIWGSSAGTPHRREEIGADVHVLSQMKRLTDSWLTSSATVKMFLKKSIGTVDTTGEAATLGKAGYTGEF
jgi:hypothetical protein